MRELFVRPWLAKVFYAVAVIMILLAALSLAGYVSRGFGGQSSMLLFFIAGYALLIVPAGLVLAALFAAVGFIIEKVAKIEWNTRPEGHVER